MELLTCRSLRHFQSGIDEQRSCDGLHKPASAASGTVITIIATSVTDSGKSATASTLISGIASNAILSGQYGFFLTSPTGNRGAASLLGSIALNGDGTVAGGIADIISPGILNLQDHILPTSANPQPNTSSATPTDVHLSRHGSRNARKAGDGTRIPRTGRVEHLERYDGFGTHLRAYLQLFRALPRLEFIYRQLCSIHISECFGLLSPAKGLGRKGASREC